MARLMEIFSDAEDYEIGNRVNKAWEFVKGFPLPKFNMACLCSSTDIKVSAFAFSHKDKNHITQKGGMEYGCDAVFRCRQCNRYQYYCIAMSEEQFKLRSPNGVATTYHWEKALAVINSER